MAVPTHIKIVFRGIFENTEEQWSFSTKWQRAKAGSSDADVDDINQSAVTAALGGLIGNGSAASFSSSILATEWRAYVIGTNGNMEGNPLLVTLATPIRGGGGINYSPSTSLCVTTVADDRGPARFGRFFLPAPGAPLTDWRLTAVNAGLYATAATTFLKAVSGAIDIPASLESSDMINVSVLPAPGGSWQSVDHVKVGRVYDNNSTRRRQLPEEHVDGAQIDW